MYSTPAAAPAPLGLLIPGQLAFNTISQNPSPGKYTCSINNPKDVSELVLFLMRDMPLPEGHGIVVYSKADGGNQVGSEEWILIGCLTVSFYIVNRGDVDKITPTLFTGQTFEETL